MFFAALSGHGDADPGVEAYVSPIQLFAQAVWEQWLPQCYLEKAFSVGMRRVEEKIKNGESPWSIVAGPAAAAYASLRRLGWRAVSYNTWLTPDGARLPAEEFSARDIRQLVRRDAVDQLWRDAGEKRTAFNGFRAKPLVQPILSLLSAKRQENWDERHKGQLRSLLADAWWGGDICPLCQQHGWSVFHALWTCPAVEVFQRNYGFSMEFLSIARASPCAPMFATGLLHDPSVDFPGPLMNNDVTWQTQPGFSVFFGPVGFGDGSGLNVKNARTRRCGWCVCSPVSLQSTLRAHIGVCAYGPLAGVIQEVPLAEAFAVLFSCSIVCP